MVKEIDFSKKGKKTPLWKELGFQPIKSSSGKSTKGYVDKSTGEYFSERQFRQKFVGTPMKGSKGYKERQAAKKAGIDFRPATQESAWADLKKAAQTPGMTMDWFQSKKMPIAPDGKRSTAEHNAYVDKQRRDAIKFKKSAGVLSDKEARAALNNLKQFQKHRDKAVELREALKNGKLSRADRERMEKEYRTTVRHYKKANAKLEKTGLVLPDEAPPKESLRYGYYHA